MESAPPSQLSSVDEERVRLHVLCEACKRIFGTSQLMRCYVTEDRPVRETMVLHPSLQALEDAAQKGCHVCTLLQYTMLETRKSPISRPMEGEAVGVKFKMINHGIRLYPQWKGWEYQPLILGSIPSLSNYFPDHEIPEYQSKHTFSQAHAQLASRWFDWCCRKHDNCATGLNATLPTRLVKLSSGHKNHIRLCITNKEEREPIKYAALSHCWGGADDTLKLTTTNLSHLLGGIPCTDLPRNLQDAVTVTKWLGLEYIWIDSLCIIQSSPDDWAKEATTMASVYMNSACTIVTAASPDSHHSCFAQRDLLRVLPCRITAPDGAYFHAYRYRRIGQYKGFLPWKRDFDALHTSHLNTRAWTYQELILSPRTLIFAPTGIIWSCKTSSAVDTFPGGWKVARDAAHLYDNVVPGRQTLERISTLMLSANNGAYKHEFNRLWFSIVQGYAQRQLTRPEDKLIGLSAIAQQVRVRTGFEYVAGLWRTTLALDLLWNVVPMSTHAHKPPYRAPSWSWASVEGPITGLTRLREGAHEVLIKTVSVAVDAHPEDRHKTGQVFSASLRLVGVLIKLRNPVSQPSQQPRSPRWVEKSTDIHADHADIDPAADDELAQTCYLLPVLIPPSSDTLHGLVLRSHGGYYTRVGTFLTALDSTGLWIEHRSVLCGDKEDEEIVVR